MTESIFPEKTDPDIPDEEWLKYCIGTWCCNSLNACEWRLQLIRGTLQKADYYFMSEKELNEIATYLNRAQKVIWWLYSKLEEEKNDRQN